MSGVTVLAWARINDLGGATVESRGANISVINKALISPAQHAAKPSPPPDDVITDGPIITAENFD